MFDTALQEGAPALAATMIAILLGSWLGKLLEETGIAGTLVRKIVEFGGDRPVFVALGVLAVSALVGTVTGSAPAAMLAGLIGIPAMIAVGIPKVTAAGTILMGIAAGMPFELPVWQFFSTALDLPVDTVRGFMLKLFPFALVAAIAYVLVESRRGWSTPGRSNRFIRRRVHAVGAVSGSETPPGTRCSLRWCRWCWRWASTWRSSLRSLRVCCTRW